MTDLLPDSRPIQRRGALLVGGVNYVPVYCVNCGRRYGMVPEAHITHVFALCDHGCAGKYGDLAHHYKSPDDVYNEHVVEAQMEAKGRLLTRAEWERALESGQGGLASAARDWQARQRRVA